MAQEEEHSQRCGSGGGNNRSSKKLKQKKIPQRGLGVAQLEKIRLEEQQKKDAAIQAATILSSPNSLTSPTNVQCATTNFRHNNPSPSSLPLPPLPPTDLSSPNSIFRPTSSIPNIDVLHPNSDPLSKPSNGGAREIGWPLIPGFGQGNLPKLWNGDHNLEGENHRLDHLGFTFRPNMNLPFESNSIWLPPNLIQRTQQFQQQPASSSMVNVSSGTSSSSSVINYHQMEPPSNQSFYGNNYTPLWPEDEKMVGMKRPHPFSIDNPPGPPFPRKFPSTNVPPTTRSDESASCGNGGIIHTETSYPVFREGPLNSTVMSESSNPKKVTKETGDLNGDFLSLAPPTTASHHPSSKYKHPLVYPTQHSRRELTEFESLPYQGSAEDPIHQPRGPRGSTQQQPFYNFFPSPNAQIGQGTTTESSCSGKVGEKLDLKLKL